MIVLRYFLILHLLYQIQIEYWEKQLTSTENELQENLTVMKIQCGSFMKNTMTGAVPVSLAGIFLVLILEGCGMKTDVNKTNMKKLIVKEIDHKGVIDLDLAEQLLENNAEFQFIETINWAEYPYKPEVKFKMAYCKNQIFLKYYVNEENIMARETRVNGDVYKDSCVEFFVSTNGKKTYYNFEFNCVGIPHVGYGPGRENRALIDPEILKLIKVRSSLGNQPFEERTGRHQWEMMIVMPKECLIYDKDIVLKGLKANANFYKCGDETSKPHFVTWNPIGTETPDYHQPAYFGELSFE